MPPGTSVLGVGVLLLGSACAVTEDGARAGVEAIERVLAADEAAAAARDREPEQMPAAEAVRRYVRVLDDLDLDACPPDFARVFRSHVEAWRRTVPLLEAWPDERGELHALLERVTTRHDPAATELERAIDEVWSTWADVEESLRRHGIEPG